MAQQVKRAFKYRFYPTDEQAAELSRTFGCVRLVYNKALEERTAAWYGEQRRVSYVQSSAQLTEWKKTEDLAFLAEVSCVPLQQALRHLQTAFGNFFAKRTKYPRYKSKKKSRASAEYTRSAFTWRDGKLTLAKMTEPLDIRWSRPLPEGGTDHGDGVPRCGRALVRLDAVRRHHHPGSGHHGGGRYRRGHHVPGDPLDGGEGRQPPARAP
jgi:putative transposase